MAQTFAVGVLDALKMYASWISLLAEVVALKCRWTCDNRCFEAAEGFLMEDMAYRRDMMGTENSEPVLQQKKLWKEEEE